MPDFMRQIREEHKAGVAHTFLLHFNVTDLARDPIFGYLTMLDYLMEQLNDIGCDVVVAYDRSQGVIFPNVGLRSEYQKLLGLDIKLPEGTEVKRPPINSKLHIKKAGIPREPEDALPRLEQLLRQRLAGLRIGVIIYFVERIAPNGDPVDLPEETLVNIETIERWAMDLEMKFLGSIVLLVAENLADVSPQITTNTHIRIVEVPLPDYQDRLEFIKHLLNLPEPEKKDSRMQLVNKLRLERNMSPEKFAAMTAGLRLIDIHDLALKAEEVNKPITEEIVIQRKYESVLYRSRGLLELIRPSNVLQFVGGLDHASRYFRPVIEMLMRGDPETPMGVLLVGPPGTGKTLTVEAMAGINGLTCVRLKTAREVWLAQQAGTFETWERMYERDLSLALTTIRNLAPVVVFIDEMERFTLERGTGFQRILPIELLNFMDNPQNRGKVLWVGATSRPDLIDPSFRKAGRFDDKLVYLIPHRKDRADILRKMFAKHRIPHADNLDLNKLAGGDFPEEITGADLELIARRSLTIAQASGHKQVMQNDLMAAARDFVPRYSPQVYEFLSLLALREANSRFMVPERVPDSIRKIAFDGERIDKAKIESRLIELERELRIRQGSRYNF
ncbi:ATP-binding protein [Candidatus Poribacteria bacterium]|nr:ATP-binding protein [Candidatus Poribacteria bacterium]